MNLRHLIFRNLWYYRRSHLAVLAGIIVGTAVLTGALIVGDSVRYSLVQIAEKRLGSIHYAILPGDRIFRQELAHEISEKSGRMVLPILQTEAIAISNENNTRINRVTVTGINKDFPGFWPPTHPRESENIQLKMFPTEDEAVVNSKTASRLGIKPGDDILIRLRTIEMVSSNSPFTPGQSNPAALRLRVKTIASDEEMGRFSLKNEQSPPYNIFVNLQQLAGRLKLDGLANGLLIAEAGSADGHDRTKEPPISHSLLDSMVSLTWQPADVGLEIEPLDQPNMFSITSTRIFISEQQVLAIKKAIPGATPVLSYMINSISANTRCTPYSFVAAIDTGLLHEKPGPGEIIINQWLSDDLRAKPGDHLQLTYWVMGPMRTLHEERALFRVKSVVPVSGIPSGQMLMPDFPGVSDAGSCRDWETGSPVDLSKIRNKDEQYWTEHRGTPKAFISIESGRKLWENVFGNATAFRFSAHSDSIPVIKKRLMQHLLPKENGILFRPVYDEGRVAASQSTDFGELFLGLSFFIIVAALLLTALLFSLHVAGRMEEAGVLAAIGFRKPAIKRILMYEALLIALAGSILGALSGILINGLMLNGLNTLWYDAVRTSSLVPCIKPATLITGALTGVIIATAVLAISLRRKLRMATAQLVKGVPDAPRKTGLRHPRNIVAVVLLALGTFAIIVTGANRKSISDETAPESGTGGFLLWAETTIPILKNINTNAGKIAYDLVDDTIFNTVSFLPLQRLAGDDASCLNLNQVARPPLLSIPTNLFDSLRLFSFATSDTTVDADHPWKSRSMDTSGNLIPAFADMTVITWGLQKKIGDTLRYTDEKGNPVLFRIAGGLNNSIFQGHLLIDEKRFRQLYPSVSGSGIVLVNGPRALTEPIARALEERFRDHGMMAIPATEKLASFNAVENTYLTVFMMLGGLGMVIGTIGLGIILWRNILERTRELSLLRAIGYPKRCILKRLVYEYLHILITGLGVGVAASLLVLLPNFLNPGYHFPATWVTGILTLIFLSGLFWIVFPVKTALNKEILKGLREE